MSNPDFSLRAKTARHIASGPGYGRAEAGEIMSSSLALVRASAIIPLELWLRANGRDAAGLLRQVGLPPSPSAVPGRLVSMHAYAELLVRLSEVEGPDFAVRLATEEALMRLGAPTVALRASNTIREALQNVSRTFHRQAPNVFLQLRKVQGGIEVTQSVPRVRTDVALHQVQQQFAGFVARLGDLVLGRTLPASFAITPDPVAGIDHLRRWLGPDIRPSTNHSISIRIADEVLDHPSDWQPDQNPDVECPGDSAACTTFAERVRILVAGLVQDGDSGLNLLARTTCRSKRTLQRLLAAEGTSYAALLDAVRRDAAIQQLTVPVAPISAIATGVGYRHPSSLSRAVRRWAGESPRRVRRAARME
jgi:AraC-like DNA-binding protein